MKRIVSVICIFIFCIQTCVCAEWKPEEDGYETRYYPQLEKLQRLRVLPEDNERKPKSFVTRREVLEAAWTLHFVMRLDADDKANYLEVDWIDVEPNTYDAYILNDAYVENIITGKIDEKGNLYADLDSYATCEEAILMIIRALNQSSNEGFDEKYIKKFAQANELAENNILLFAQECGLINYVAPYDDKVFFVPSVDIQEATKPMIFLDFVGVLDRALYMPIWGGYHAPEPIYLIDLFIEYEKNYEDYE